MVGFCPIEGFHKKAKLYCELYAANLCARQFGLLQGIPVFYAQSRNFLFPNRTPLSFPDEMVIHMSAQTSREALFNYEPFSFTPDVTVAFTAWWEAIRSRLFERPISAVLGLFSFTPSEPAGGSSAPPAGPKRRLSPGCSCHPSEHYSSSTTSSANLYSANLFFFLFFFFYTGMEAKIEDDTSSSSTYGDSRVRVTLIRPPTPTSLAHDIL